MGTNYYWLEDVCSQCGHSAKTLHIGKSSGGWCFSLQVIPEEGINNLDDWVARWTGNGKIQDEYEDEITAPEMLKIITEREWKRNNSSPPYRFVSWEEFHKYNHSIDGPNGLLRHRIDGTFCIAHGSGTYDLIKGDFS